MDLSHFTVPPASVDSGGVSSKAWVFLCGATSQPPPPNTQSGSDPGGWRGLQNPEFSRIWRDQEDSFPQDALTSALDHR